MNVDRYMVNLFFEIKRNLPQELQLNLKLSSPTLMQDMIDLTSNTDDENIKVLIDRFFERAKIDVLKIQKEAKKKAQRKMKAVKRKKVKAPRYYRGALLE